jgi:alkylation response protein AidB-like acyl-CoA dehydrogenase
MSERSELGSALNDPVIPDLLESDVEADLRATVRALLEKRAPAPDVLRRTESDEPVDRALWAALVEVGVAGLPVPEKLGGAGASWREAAVVAEELGRAVAPVPFLGHAMAVAALLAAGDEDLLPELAMGERTATLVLPFDTMPGAAPTGTRNVADARTADVLVVPAGSGASAELVAIEASTATITPVLSLDMTRPLADLDVDPSGAGRVVARGEAAHAAVEHGLRMGVMLLAAEQVGVADRVLEMTVAYLKERRQFGRIIGSYQALKHRTADLWVALTQARAVARYAAVCAATDAADLPVAAALAKAHCGPVALRTAEEGVQLHGGIGFTWEHPAHLYLKRAAADAVALGSADRHRAALARLVDVPGPVA